MNTDNLPRWSFTSAVSVERQDRMAAWTVFSQILEALANSPVAPLYWEAATSPALAGCRRASFEVHVGHDLYDAFFNAPVGYRGQFARSETCGEATNRQVIERLRSQLLRVATEHQTADVAHVAASLDGPQAKMWIVESEVDEQLTDPAPSLIYEPWEFEAPDGQGLRTPYGTKLEVKGAWVDGNGITVFNPGKSHRSSHINRTGDSK